MYSQSQHRKRKKNLARSFMIIAFLFLGFTAKAQYPRDSVAVKYEVLSIRQAKQAHISYLRKQIKKVKSEADRKNRTLLGLKEYKKEIKRSTDSKNGYVITLRNVDGGYFDVASAKINGVKGEKIKVGKSYEMKLYEYFEESIYPRIGKLFVVTINNVKIRVVGQSWTWNVYTTPNLNGIYYIPPID